MRNRPWRKKKFGDFTRITRQVKADSEKREERIADNPIGEKYPLSPKGEEEIFIELGGEEQYQIWGKTRATPKKKEKSSETEGVRYEKPPKKGQFLIKVKVSQIEKNQTGRAWKKRGSTENEK